MSKVREKLIEATFNEVHTFGYKGASLSIILNKAEVKKGTMYYFFPSKKAMVLSMIEEKFEKTIEKEWSKLISTNENIIDTLIDILMDNNWDLEKGSFLGNLLQEYLDNDRDFSISLTLILDKWIKVFSIALQKAQEKKQINKNIDISECSVFIIASIEGAILLSKKYENSNNFKKCINQLVFYLNNLRAK